MNDHVVAHLRIKLKPQYLVAFERDFVTELHVKLLA